jgi:integrase/recombinase XerD
MDEDPAIPVIEGLQIHPLQGWLMVTFAYHPDNVERIKNVDGRRRHPAEKCWSIPHTDRAVSQLRDQFSVRPPTKYASAKPSRQSRTKGTQPTSEERIFLEPTRQELRLRGFSRNTVKSYCHHLLRYHRHIQRAAGQVGEIEIRQYLLRLIDNGVSRSYLNQAISAIKFLYNRVLKTPLVVGDLPRPRRERTLPIVLSRGEVLSIFAALDNPKHRALLMVAYSSGLRVSEVARLKVADIDIERMMVRVHRAKGNKDRYTPLSRVALETLEIPCY